MADVFGSVEVFDSEVGFGHVEGADGVDVRSVEGAGKVFGDGERVED